MGTLMSTCRPVFSVAFLCFLSSTAPLASAATFTVTNTNDSGAGSLRRAIVDANADAVIDLIHFAIPVGSCAADGVCTITLDSTLPDIVEGVVIDGTTQPRYGSAPANVCAAPSTPSYMRIFITSTADDIINITASGQTTLRGLAIAGAIMTDAVNILTLAGTIIECNHFGVDGPGATALELGIGICIACSGDGGNAVIGTDGDGDGDRAERNVFGDGGYAVYINAGDASNPNRISGNYFGVGADGTTPMSLSGGVFMRQGVSETLIGSDLNGISDDLESNVFAYLSYGVRFGGWMTTGNSSRVVGNWFGLDAFGRPAPIFANAIRAGYDGENIEVRNNQVLSSAVGIAIKDVAYLSPSSGQNCIMGNDVGVIHEGTVVNLDVEDNYWGASDGPSGLGPGSGDSIEVTGSGSVDFTPFLTSPAAVCVVVMRDGFESGNLDGWSSATP